MKRKAKKFGMGGMPGTPVLDKTQPPPAASAAMPVRPPQLPQAPVPAKNRPFLQSVGLAGGRGMGGPRGGMGGPRGGMGGMGGLGGMSGPLGGVAKMPPGYQPDYGGLDGIPTPMPQQMKKGGMTASKRADGCAQRGKTRGKMR